MAMIELRQFSAGYPGRDWTVRNVDLTIQPGETVGLIGPNGSGKTTLIRGICSRIPLQRHLPSGQAKPPEMPRPWRRLSA